MAIFNVSQKLALETRYGELVSYFRQQLIAPTGTIATAQGYATSLWTANGAPGKGVAPGAVAAPTVATAGALPFTAAGSGRSVYLTSVTGASGISGLTVFYDRLLHISGFSGTSTGVQTVGGALTRYTGGVGNWIAIEIYTALGATPRVLTVNYTNQAGAAKSVTVTLGGTNALELGRFIVCPLATGDTGVQGVTSVQLDASTGTAGDFGVTVGHNLVSVPNALAGCISERNLLGDSGVLVQAGACIAAYVQAYTASAVSGTFCWADYHLHLVQA
jgi:hypothetical protein